MCVCSLEPPAILHVATDLPVLQAMPKLPEVQAAMTQYFVSQASRAGLGLELLPGVQSLLEALKVRCSRQAYHVHVHLPENTMSGCNELLRAGFEPAR